MDVGFPTAAPGRTRRVPRTVALVESPAQLLNVVEWSYVAPDAGDLRVVVLAPADPAGRRQLRATMALVRAAGHPVSWCEARVGAAAVARTVRALTRDLAGLDRLVLGDAFSGVMQVVLTLSRPREVVLVDDGTATLELVRQLPGGEPLQRWHAGAGHAVTRLARGSLGAAVRQQLVSPTTSTTLFTCLPVTTAAVAVEPNTYRWLRDHVPPPALTGGTDLVGTSLAETGVVEPGRYLAGVAALAARHQADRYFAHRRESADKLAAIAGLGLTVVQPDLPLEVVARRGPAGRRLVSFPSTVVHSLPHVLSGTASEVVVCDVEDTWFAVGASVRSGAFLAEVTATARRRHGLASTACRVAA